MFSDVVDLFLLLLFFLARKVCDVRWEIEQKMLSREKKN